MHVRELRDNVLLCINQNHCLQPARVLELKDKLRSRMGHMLKLQLARVHELRETATRRACAYVRNEKTAIFRRN